MQQVALLLHSFNYITPYCKCECIVPRSGQGIPVRVFSFLSSSGFPQKLRPGNQLTTINSAVADAKLLNYHYF